MRVLISALSVFSAAMLFAQSPSVTPPRPASVVASHPEWPKANPGDVASIENIIRAFYSAVSAPAGGKLDQNRLRSLFVPGGRIVASRPASSSGAADICFLTPEEYAALSDAHNAEGFFDSNAANQIETFGAMAHVYSTYESRSNLDDPKPMARGIKSFELLHSGDRWYIVEMYWDSERPNNPIPERYLHNS